MVQNRNFQNPIHPMENTPLVTIVETNVAKRQATAQDSRGAVYFIDLAKASFGGIHYPSPGSQWLLKKVSGVWALMARGPLQSPQLSNTITPQPGDTVIGGTGTTYVTGTGISANGSFVLTEPTAGTTAFGSKVTGDTIPRWSVDGGGTHHWGPGNASPDTNLYRSAAGVLTTDSSFQIDNNSALLFRAGSSVSNTIVSSRLTGDTNDHFEINADGTLNWGGGSTGTDVNLYRGAASWLYTDADFNVRAEIRTTQGSTGNNAFSTWIAGDANPMYLQSIDGVQRWGPGGGTSIDTYLYREGTQGLRTNGWFHADQMGLWEATTGSSIAGFTNTTYQANASNTLWCGVVFTAPPSGRVLLMFSVQLQSNTAGQNALVSPKWFTGGTLNSGTNFSGPSDSTAVEILCNGTSATATRVHACNFQHMTGLTAGAQYNVILNYRMGGTGNGSLFFQNVIVQPQMA